MKRTISIVSIALLLGVTLPVFSEEEPQTPPSLVRVNMAGIATNLLIGVLSFPTTFEHRVEENVSVAVSGTPYVGAGFTGFGAAIGTHGYLGDRALEGAHAGVQFNYNYLNDGYYWVATWGFSFSVAYQWIFDNGLTFRVAGAAGYVGGAPSVAIGLSPGFNF